jgi:hypothetical protein
MDFEQPIRDVNSVIGVDKQWTGSNSRISRSRRKQACRSRSLASAAENRASPAAIGPA